MTANRIIFESTPEHLCATCKYQEKCRRTKAIHSQLSDVESDALEKWKINVDVTYQINECEMYAIDWNLVDAISEAIDRMDDREDDEDDG